MKKYFGKFIWHYQKLISMFVAMEENTIEENPELLFSWYEILDEIPKKGKRQLKDGESVNGVYTAMRKFDSKLKKFSIRTHPFSGRKYIVRTK